MYTSGTLNILERILIFRLRFSFLLSAFFPSQ